MKVLFSNKQSPGDILMLSAAIRDLKLAYPEIQIGIDTTCKELFENNPHINKEINKGTEEVEIFDIGYSIIHNSNEGCFHFINGFRMELEKQLDLIIPATKMKGDIHLSTDEKKWQSQIEEMNIKDKFWIINAGCKWDYTAKLWRPDYYQQVVDHFKGKITFAQIGQKEHFHPSLNGVINLIGKTDLRQIVRLMYHAVGVITPVSFPMHLSVAVECKHDIKNRACVVISGGREPSTWEAYTNHQFLHTCGALRCCDNGGSWKSRCSQVGDGDDKDKEENLCLNRVKTDLRFKDDNDLYIPKCMDMIKPEDVIRAVEKWYIGGVLEYGSSLNNNTVTNSKIKKRRRNKDITKRRRFK